MAAGEPIAWHFTLGTSRRAVVAEELRRRGYDCRKSRRATLSATNLGRERGYLLRQQYQWLPPDA